MVFKGTNHVEPCKFFNVFSCEVVAGIKDVNYGIIDPVKVTLGIGTVFGIAGYLIVDADLVLSCDNCKL